ncbi:MAG TPA: hypothetical protein VF505_18985 [Thermoanaerobaculia bacterium]
MRRSVGEILRLGFESMLANWPLLIIRIVESVVLVVLIIVAIVAVIVPVAVSFGASNSWPAGDPGDAMNMILTIIATHAVMILYILVMILVVLTVFLMIHSFVTAGSASVYVASLRQTAAMPHATRDQMDAFTTDRWFEGAKATWWAVFWIYNIAWSVGFLIMFVPFAFLAGAVIVVRENAAAAAITGCVGAFFIVLLLLPIAIVTGIWTQKAIVDCVARRTGAMDSLRAAWAEFRADLGRHLAVAAVMVLVSFGAAMVVGSMSAMMSFGQHPNGLMLIPMQFSSSILNSVVSAAVSAWFLACFAALAVERP